MSIYFTKVSTTKLKVFKHNLLQHVLLKNFNFKVFVVKEVIKFNKVVKSIKNYTTNTF